MNNVSEKLKYIKTNPLNNPEDAGTIKGRINYLRDLKDGWCDRGFNGGIAPPHKGLNWLEYMLISYYPADLPQPYIYPTLEGGVELKWHNLSENRVILEINLEEKTGDWHLQKLYCDLDEYFEFDLSTRFSWYVIVRKIRKLIKTSG